MCDSVRNQESSDDDLMLLFQTSEKSDEVDNLMKELDANRDGVVDFQEFVVLFASLAMICHEFFQDMDSKKGSQGCKKPCK